jgi:peptidoglycan biosynthesis protein MviN/MurJ (putative lipid II flippase)
VGALALFYAERLIYLPQGILATALGTVLLPVLSDFAAQKSTPRCAKPSTTGCARCCS